MKAVKYLITAGITAAVLALTACSGGKGSASEQEPLKAETEMKAELEAELEKAEMETEKQVEQNGAERAEYVKLTPEEAKEVMDGSTELIIVDVRTPEEYGDSHIGNAVNVPVEEIGEEEPAELPDLDAEIMVYCRSGVRSKQAAEKLLDLGYKNIKDIGGIKDWPYETVAGDDK